MKRLQITLSEEATQKYMKIMSAENETQVESDCEPSGATLLVEINPITDAEVSIIQSN